MKSLLDPRSIPPKSPISPGLLQRCLPAPSTRPQRPSHLRGSRTISDPISSSRSSSRQSSKQAPSSPSPRSRRWLCATQRFKIWTSQQTRHVLPCASQCGRLLLQKSRPFRRLCSHRSGKAYATSSTAPIRASPLLLRPPAARVPREQSSRRDQKQRTRRIAPLPITRLGAAASGHGQDQSASLVDHHPTRGIRLKAIGCA